MRKIALSKILSLVISVLMLYTATMLKRGNGKTYRLYKKTIYSHKKPQRPQRAQRIIKDAITKTTLNLFAKLSFAQRFACSAVKLKNIRSCLK